MRCRDGFFLAARLRRKKVKAAAMYWQKIWVYGYLKNAAAIVCKEDRLQGNACVIGFKG